LTRTEGKKGKKVRCRYREEGMGGKEDQVSPPEAISPTRKKGKVFEKGNGVT